MSIVKMLFAGIVAASFPTICARAQSSPPPVQIGISVSLTGGFADAIRPAMLADQVWEKEINARGGLLGRKVTITYRDNRSNADDGAAIYQRFLQSGFDFIFEDGGAFLVQRTSTLAEQRHKLFLAPNAFSRSLYERGYKYLFFTGPSLSEDLNIGLIGALRTLPENQQPKTVGYLTIENIAFTSMTKGFQDLAAPLKLEPVLDVTYPPNINDATSLVENLKQSKPDMIVNSGLTNDTLLLARALKQQDVKAKLVVISQLAGTQPTFLSTFGTAAEGMVYASPWEPQLKLTGNQEFVASYEDMHKLAPTYNAAQAYARWQVLEQAIKATNSFEDNPLRDYIASHEFDTVVGKLKFNQNGYSTPKETIVTQIQGGARMIVWPKEYASSSLRYPAN
jgi:branched-chain amino acid transport system substrate-binding protein